MHKGFFADALSNRPLLWQAMLRANSRPSPCALTVETERVMGTFAAPVLAWLGQGSNTSSTVAAPEPFWDFAEESRRLALLDEGAVLGLTRIAGVALHAPEVAQVVQRDAQIALRQSLGEDLYRYALYRGQYQSGGVRRFFQQMHTGLPLAERCALHGSMALRLVAGLWPVALVQCFLSLLPPLPEEHPLPTLAEGEIRELWFVLKKLLLKEVAPAWAQSFS